MSTTFIMLTLIFVLAISGVHAEYLINTPTLIQCQNVDITWQGGVAPYNLVVVPTDAPCSDILIDLGDHSTTSMTWKVNLTAGSNVEFSLLDSIGEEAWSGSTIVQASNVSSCLTRSSASSSSSKHTSTTLIAGGSNPSYTPSPSPSATVVGAANAGSNPTKSSGVPSKRPFSSAALAIAAFAVITAITL